jgi:hypothetical protein
MVSMIKNPVDDMLIFNKELAEAGEQASRAATYFRGNTNLANNFAQFTRLNHRDRMTYKGDGGAWHPDAEKFNKTEAHEKWVQQQIVRDRHTMPIFPKPAAATRSVRSFVNDIISEANDSEGPGGIGDDFKEIL